MSSGERFLTLLVILLVIGVWANYRTQIRQWWASNVTAPPKGA